MPSLLNYFRFIFSGNLRRTKRISGYKLHYKYRHDAELFDPFMILADHYYKISHTQKPYVLEIENWKFDTEKYFSWVAEKKAKVYCKMFFPLGLFEVERHVVKEQHRTTSFYLFMLDKEVFAFWHKKYDYGRDRLSVIEEDIFPAGMFIEPILKNEEEPILVKGHENQILYVEKFVHTHLFYIRDQEKFNQLIRQIKDLKILP